MPPLWPASIRTWQYALVMAEEAQSSDSKNLKDAFKRAAEIAAVVPDSMQEAAFHRALDQILGTAKPAHSSTRRTGRQRSDQAVGKEGIVDNAELLVDGINRTAYPEVISASKVLDRALAVLRLAKRDFEIDGLTAPEIAKVLTDKFRQRTSRQAVSQALGAAHSMVDTRSRGRTTVYRIMQEGEDHIERGVDQDQAAETGRAPRTRRRRRTSGTAAGRGVDTTPTRSTGRGGRKSTARHVTRRRGPKTALGELIDEGYFSQARTINEAQEQLRHKKGLRFTLQDLSPSFVRLLREGRLDRDRNASGQYEYRSR
jgi:hypothetical protein